MSRLEPSLPHDHKPSIGQTMKTFIGIQCRLHEWKFFERDVKNSPTYPPLYARLFCILNIFNFSWISAHSSTKLERKKNLNPLSRFCNISSMWFLFFLSNSLILMLRSLGFHLQCFCSLSPIKSPFTANKMYWEPILTRIHTERQNGVVDWTT